MTSFLTLSHHFVRIYLAGVSWLCNFTATVRAIKGDLYPCYRINTVGQDGREQTDKSCTIMLHAPNVRSPTKYYKIEMETH